MRTPIITAALIMIACVVAVQASAATADAWTKTLPLCSAETSARGPWAVEFGELSTPVSHEPLRVSVVAFQEPPVRRPIPVEYSDFYKARAKVHKIASFATLPLFIANYFVGQDLYNHPGDESNKGLHVGLAASTGVLFGINTVTGVWNLWEGRKDPNHRAKRMTHGILMMIADAGFLATASLAPDDDEHEHGGAPTTSSGASTHRTVALTSMAIATVSYLIMLFGGH